MQDLRQHPLGRYSQPSPAGMLDQQHQDDDARATEQRRPVAIALASRLDNGHATRVARARTVDVLRTRLAAVRPAVARVSDGPHYPVTSRASAIVTCCA